MLIVMSSSLISCGGSKKVSQKSVNDQDIVQYASSFIGTPYRYGGTSRRGMDCSGLIYQVYLGQGKALPRTTKDLSRYGQKVQLNRARIGDLLFFKTSKKWGGINHVGLITKIDGNSIEFIHSTTSRGVIISGLNENYWSRAYKFARRIP
jgi:cell wall-associated NlpC family hydrolase